MYTLFFFYIGVIQILWSIIITKISRECYCYNLRTCCYIVMSSHKFTRNEIPVGCGSLTVSMLEKSVGKGFNYCLDCFVYFHIFSLVCGLNSKWDCLLWSWVAVTRITIMNSKPSLFFSIYWVVFWGVYRAFALSSYHLILLNTPLLMVIILNHENRLIYQTVPFVAQS